jgi:hypothetical protein
MFKNIITIITISSSLLYFTGCVGQPKVSDEKIKNSSDSGTLWAENTNIDRDENSVDISDLDKNISSARVTLEPLNIIQRIPFPTAEYQALARDGKGTINGYIYVEDTYGKKIYGKNSKLYLNPITSYSKQWYKESYQKGQKMSKADSKLFNYVKFTASGDDGRFAFYGVPSGGYYLTGNVMCGYECGYDTPKNIRIATEVYLYGNEIVNQDINKRLN